MKNRETYFIEELSKERYEFIEIQDNSWDEKSGKYTIEPPEIDQLQENILSAIHRWKDVLTFEFIFEELTKLGWGPSLLYDDDGRFAVIGDGFQTLPMESEPIDMELSFWVKKDRWKNTVREALYAYLSDE